MCMLLLGILSVGPFPKPVITVPTDLLVRVHAASINPIDFKTMRGNLAMILKEGSTTQNNNTHTHTHNDVG